MKHLATAFAAAAALTPLSAFAHGTAIVQAGHAIASATELFLGSQPTATVRAFKTVIAEKVGHEQFQVTITLADGTAFGYACQEDETVDPVTWPCVAN